MRVKRRAGYYLLRGKRYTPPERGWELDLGWPEPGDLGGGGVGAGPGRGVGGAGTWSGSRGWGWGWGVGTLAWSLVSI